MPVKRRLGFVLLVLLLLAGGFAGRLTSPDQHLFIRRDVGGHGHSYLYYDDGSATRRVAIGDDNEIGLWNADLSPDGSRIAFKQRSFLYLYDLASNRLTPLNAEPLYPSESTSIRWSPDGSQVGFPCSPVYGEPIQVCAWDLATGEMQVLTDLKSYGNYDYLSFGGWSADAASLVFMLFYPEDYATGMGRQLILRLDTGSGDITPVLDSEAAALNVSDTLALSPDGKTILFNANTRTEQQEEGFGFSLYQVNSDGSGLRRLVETDGWSLFEPVWSPDGSSFYINATDYYRMIPLRYDRSGRLIGLLPAQSGRAILSWRGVESGK